MAELTRSRSFLIRTATALLLIPVTLLFLWLDRIFIVIFVLSVINLALIEFLRICHRKNIYPYPACLFVLGNVIPFAIYFSFPPLAIASLSLFYIALLSTLRFDKTSFLDRVSVTVFASIYLVVLPSFVILLRKIGFAYCLFPMVLTWIFDTGAYLAGMTLGRKRLAPTISPKKSYEGVAGGLLLILPATYLLNGLFQTGLSLKSQLAVALGISILATLGDLFESAFKRETDLKNTSNLFPGHGGALDRIDSLLFTIPFFYIFLKLSGY